MSRARPTSWTGAYEYLTERIKTLLAEGKPVGVLGSARATNEENYLAGKLARAGLHTNNLDFCGHAACRPLLEGFEHAAGPDWPCASLKDVVASDLIVLVEGNLAETHPQAASAVMRALRQRARLITMGCRTTQMARLASLHLPTAPGREGEAVNELLAAARWMDRIGANDASPDGGPGATRPSDSSLQAAKWLARAARVSILVPPLAGPPDRCQQNAAALAALGGVSGSSNHRVFGLLPLLSRGNTRGACDMGVAPDRLPGYEPIDARAARQRLQDLWGTSLPSSSGKNAASCSSQYC